MIEALQAFAQTNPLVFYVGLAILLSAINGAFVYWSRKKLPGLWLWFERDSKLASEALKTMPGTFPIAVIGAGAGGAQVAFYGYLIGLGSIVGHHVLKLLPSWLAPYRGELGKLLDKKLGTGALLFSLVLIACTPSLATGCAGQREPRTPAQIAERQACLALADANKLQAGKRECNDKGVPWRACPAAAKIKAQHRKEMNACPY